MYRAMGTDILSPFVFLRANTDSWVTLGTQQPNSEHLLSCECVHVCFTEATAVLYTLVKVFSGDSLGHFEQNYLTPHPDFNS